MLIVLSVILIALAIIFFILHSRKKEEGRRRTYSDYCCGFAVLGGFSTAIAILLIIWMCCLWCSISTEYTIDQEIAMYEEENAKIETEISMIVSNYMDYEQETLIGVSPEEDVMVLVSLFPELKSDELVKEQIAIHTSNASQIKALKQEKIDISVQKWLLYFGR